MVVKYDNGGGIVLYSNTRLRSRQAGKTRIGTTSGDSGFWRDLAKQFRALQHALGMLRAEWDYIVGSGGRGQVQRKRFRIKQIGRYKSC